MRAVIGSNADRYLRAFERTGASAGRWAPGWNWAAFAHSTAWFCYRRMYGWAFLNLFAPLLFVLGAALVGLATAQGGSSSLLMLVAVAAYLLTVFVLVPRYADAIYFRHIHAGHGKPPSGWTALGAAGFVTASVALFAALFLPVLTGGYAPRAKVSEAVLAASSLRSEIDEFYREQRRLPNEQEAARFRAEHPSRWVARIVYEPQEKRLVVTLREIQPTKRFALVAREDEGELRWICRTIDLDRKYLPPHCRE
jgi:type IV pilus assembly protein PilA